MKIKSFMTMTVAAVALVLGMSSCSSSDDEPEVALANQVAGSYTGEENLEVMGEGEVSTTTYEFAKSLDTSIDMTIPPTAGGGPMALPALLVKNIALTKEGDNITGRLASYSGTVINADGAEKAYTVTDVVILFKGNTVVLTYILKYGNMPFAFNGTFTGTKN